MRIATFNIQNLRLRQSADGARLDGARDTDAPEDFLPQAQALDAADRRLSAQVIAHADADLVALQEVFDQATLDHFHDHFLAPLGARYPYRVCLEGNDGRSADVALLSRAPLADVASHAAMTFAEIGAEPPPGVAASARVFRRDCLAARRGDLWLFVCHFKATADELATHQVRRAEARAVRAIIERTSPAPARARWLALGDFNVHDEASAADLAPLAAPFGVDLCERMAAAERWTYYQADTRLYSCPDRIIASAALAARNAASRPTVVRHGVSRAALRHDGARFAEVGARRPRASDHALLVVDLLAEGARD